MTAVEAWNRAGRPQGAYMLRSLDQDERQEITYELRQVAAVERSMAPQGQIRLLEGAADLPGRILEVDLDDDFFKTIEGNTNDDSFDTNDHLRVPLQQDRPYRVIIGDQTNSQVITPKQSLQLL